MTAIVILTVAILLDILVWFGKLLKKDSGTPILLAVIAYLLWKKS